MIFYGIIDSYTVKKNCLHLQIILLIFIHMKKDTENIFRLLRQELPFLIKKYHVKSLEIFGSYIREEQNSKSDLDLLVTFSENPGLIKFLELENYLSDHLKLKVDLVMKDSLKPRIGKYILDEAQPV